MSAIDLDLLFALFTSVVLLSCTNVDQLNVDALYLIIVKRYNFEQLTLLKTVNVTT